MNYLKDIIGPDLFKQFIGFEDTVAMLRDATAQTAKALGYPPYNIRQIDDHKYVIEVAVAGFGKSDIDITLDGSNLKIVGKTKDDAENNFLYKGIANRGFERAFTLNDTVEIKDAELINGMLSVWLENVVKTQDTVKKIAIKSK